MGKQPAQFIPVSYVNQSEDSTAGFFFNVLMALVAGAAFYNIYKGRNPGAGKNVKGKS